MFFRQIRKTGGVDARQAVEKAQNGDIHVVDVREQGEVATSGKAAGALHIPLMRLHDMADPRHPDFHKTLCKTKPVAVYCASGGRSHHAAQILTQLGYDAHNIGGLNSWLMAGGALERA